ncbi:arabinan endo-1,5-alpha-L-arabinosidase [Kineococcus xinjiangensis]|uniref:Arabinan endo-1,5-alpha-L-arabinosidase n=1 Tax=Kineococcus xinjiangensis TaxID=512762 RepID=A0A2S6IUY9_9ACTN|nr:arabinan endo-1,5-alpha-L-arabinosidase [Kineococcus xinjiangensis]PPK98090.1 arabinan endo-1,5-alpha-L-arabinosidase [Kineococcus xinjiangensis]
MPFPSLRTRRRHERSRTRPRVLTAVTAALLVAATASPAEAYPRPGYVTGDVRAHDPSMVRAADGRYYVYSTHNLVEMRTSTDRVNFSRVGSAFSKPLTWSSGYGTTTDLWAPDVSRHGGRYLMYYSVSQFRSNNSAIGFATSPSGAPGTWTDHGRVYSSTTNDNYNAIDPNLIVDSSGRWWLSFGSFWSGIKLIQIDPATGKQLASNTRRYDLATRPLSVEGAVEAPHIHQANGWYYLFVSFDKCCNGASSTYKTVVGRSRSITGPYLDHTGKDMRSGGGLVINATQGSTIGPGGQSVMRDVDGDLLVYHYYTPEGPERLGVNRLAYDANGWPYLT